MTSYRAFGEPLESKKEEYRRYLENSGTLEALTKILLSLYEETDRPTDVLNYLRVKLSGEETTGELEQLRQENALLRAKLAQYEAASNR